MGRINRKTAFEHSQNTHIQIIQAHMQIIIRVFALHSAIMEYRMILLANGDLTARMHRLSWAFAVHIVFTWRGSVL